MSLYVFLIAIAILVIGLIIFGDRSITTKQTTNDANFADWTLYIRYYNTWVHLYDDAQDLYDRGLLEIHPGSKYDFKPENQSLLTQTECQKLNKVMSTIIDKTFEAKLKDLSIKDKMKKQQYIIKLIKDIESN